MRPLTRLVRLLVVGGLLASPLLGRASAGRDLSALTENQQGQGATTGRDEVLRSFRTFFIQSKTVYLRGPVLGQALRQRPEFGAWGLAETETGETADVNIEVTLPFLSFEWNYRLLHRASGTLLASGKVSAALEKTAAPKLAEEIARQIGAVRALPEGFSAVSAPPVTTEPKTTAAAAIGAAVGRSWKAEYVEGTEPLDRKEKLTLSIEGDALVARAKRGVAFSAPLNHIAGASYQVKTDKPVSNFLGDVAAAGGEDPNSAMGALVFLLLAAMTQGIEQHTHLVSLGWTEPEGARAGVVLKFSEQEATGFVEEMNARSHQSVRPLEELAKLSARETPAAPAPPVKPPAAAPEPPASVSAPPQPPAPLEPFYPAGTRLQMKLVYEGKHVIYTPYYLDPAGEVLYRISGSKVDVIDWRNKKTVFSKRFKELPCQKQDPFFGKWTFLPGQSDLLLEHCGALFVVERKTLAVKQRLLKSSETREDTLWRPDSFPLVSVSPDGRWVALPMPLSGHPSDSQQILLFDARTWQITARMPVPAALRIGFNADGTRLVVRTGEPDCGTQVRRVPSGEIVGEFRQCVGTEAVANHGELMATMEAGRITLWDIQTGKYARTIFWQEDIASSEAAGSTFLAANWSWTLTTPEGTSARQHSAVAILRDPVSGQTLARLEKEWNVLEKLMTAGGSFHFEGASQDGRFILLYREGNYSLFEILPVKPN